MVKNKIIILDDTWGFRTYSKSFEHKKVNTKKVMRIFAHQKFKINLMFEHDIDKERLYIYAKWNGEWSFRRLLQNHLHEFELEVTEPGVYEYALSVLDLNGKICSWLPLPYCTLFVDPPSCQSINFYTFIPTVSGSYKDWFHDFLKIKEMGFDYIHLLPIVKMDSSESPYACSDFFEIDPAYCDGVPTKKIINEMISYCNKNQIRLCIDLVFNHVGVCHKICTDMPHWVKLDDQYKDGLKRAGCWHGNNWVVWEDIVLLNFEHPNEDIRMDLFNYVSKYALFWAKVAASTNGMIRYDNLHSSNFDFIKHVTKSIKAKYPELIVLSELFCGEEVRDKYRVDSHSNLLFATPWMNPYAAQLRKQIISIHESFDSVNYLFPISSHDSPSAYEMYGSHVAAVTRYAVHVFFGLGAVGVTQGIEYKVEKKIPFIGVSARSEKVIDDEIFSKLRILNVLNKTYKAFGLKHNVKFIDYEHSAILAGVRIGFSVSEPDFLIVANLNSSHEESLTIEDEIVQQFEPINLLTKETVTLKNIMKIAAGQCFILKSY